MIASMRFHWVVKQMLVAAGGVALMYGFVLVLLMYLPKLGCCPLVLHN